MTLAHLAPLLKRQPPSELRLSWGQTVVALSRQAALALVLGRSILRWVELT